MGTRKDIAQCNSLTQLNFGTPGVVSSQAITPKQSLFLSVSGSKEQKTVISNIETCLKAYLEHEVSSTLIH